jgi:hypothetical protein
VYDGYRYFCDCGNEIQVVDCYLIKSYCKSCHIRATFVCSIDDWQTIYNLVFDVAVYKRFDSSFLLAIDNPTAYTSVDTKGLSILFKNDMFMSTKTVKVKKEEKKVETKPIEQSKPTKPTQPITQPAVQTIQSTPATTTPSTQASISQPTAQVVKRTMSDAVKQKLRDIMKKKWQDPVYRQKVIEGKKKKKQAS